MTRELEAVARRPWHDPDQYGWVRPLGAQWRLVRDELRALPEPDLAAGVPRNLWDTNAFDFSGNSFWQTYTLMFGGIPFLRRARSCPGTWKLLQNVPGLVYAEFSSLGPHTSILPHRGYSAHVLRSHLPIQVPHPEFCGFEVGGEARQWREGEILVFDDTFEHRAWNDSAERRVVLMLDVLAPWTRLSVREVGRRMIEDAVIPSEATRDFLRAAWKVQRYDADDPWNALRVMSHYALRRIGSRCRRLARVAAAAGSRNALRKGEQR